MTSEQIAPVDPESLPDGEWAICEFFGHTTLVGRIPYRLTPCTAAVAWARLPQNLYQLPPSIAATLPPAALPPGQPPLDLDGVAIDSGEDEDDGEDREEY